jgi:hypothetical protein
LVDILNITSNAFSFNEAVSTTKPLLFYVIGIVIYSIFIFKFYKFVARKDIFNLNLQKYSESFFGSIAKFLRLIFYIIEYILVFPIFTFFWFSVVSLILAALSRNHAPQNILLIAMAIVASIRITAYYNEDLSKDLAKMLPFALLAVFLVDLSFFSYEASIITLKSFPAFWKQMTYYFVFIILLELILRITHPLFKPFLAKKEEES